MTESKLPDVGEFAGEICHPYPAHGSGFVMRVDRDIVQKLAEFQRQTLLAAARLGIPMTLEAHSSEYLDGRRQALEAFRVVLKQLAEEVGRTK